MKQLSECILIIAMLTSSTWSVVFGFGTLGVDAGKNFIHAGVEEGYILRQLVSNLGPGSGTLHVFS